MSFCFIMAQETLSWQREGLSRRHTRRYCGSERGFRMAARETLSSRQRIRRDPRETVSRRHARLHHGSRKMPIIAADSILQGEGETISRRHERGCVLSGSGRAYHGVTVTTVHSMIVCRHDRAYPPPTRESLLAPSLNSLSYTSIP